MDEKKNEEEVLDGVKSEAEELAKETAQDTADSVSETVAEAEVKAEELANETVQDTADSVSETAAEVKEDKKPEKPVAKVSPEYEKIVWPTAGRVWANTLTVIIVAALMAGTIFLVDLGLRAIIEGFMSI